MIYNDAKVLKIAPFFKDELNDFNNISSIYWYINETVNYLVCMSRVEFFYEWGEPLQSKNLMQTFILQKRGSEFCLYAYFYNLLGLEHLSFFHSTTAGVQAYDGTTNFVPYTIFQPMTGQQDSRMWCHWLKEV